MQAKRKKVNIPDLSEKEQYSSDDLIPYIGGPVKTDLTIETKEIIENNISEDAFGLRKTLKEIYGAEAEFREGQQEAILAVLNGKRTLVIQHTGWGKSLIYFMSIKKLREMGKGMAIIICPLLALMHNQIESTEKFQLNIKAIASDTQHEWEDIQKEIENDKVDAIIISPERFDNEDFMRFMKNRFQYTSLLVVDEAHCLSDWGHEFRPDFRRLFGITKKLPASVPVLATTATANDRVIRDIKFQLGKDLEIMRGSMERKSICIDVLNLGSYKNKILWLLKNLPKMEGSGIIYCLTIIDCMELYGILKHYNINANVYHGQMDPDEKKEIEQQFQANKIRVLIATIAFGMGIDKPDISFVIHYQQPASVIAYYQQIGRAGRGIDKSFAILLAGDSDDYINHYFISTAFPTEDEMNSVIKCIEENDGLSTSDVMQKLDLSRNDAVKILKYLNVNGDIIKNGGKYFKTSKEWECDMKRARMVSYFRWQELRRFNDYINTKECYMSFLRQELGEENVEPCGRCANCLGKHFFE